MAKKKYYLDSDKREMLEVKWTPGWKQTYVLFNNEQLAVVSKEDVSIGTTVGLSGNRTLELKLDKGLFTTLVTKINGEHIPGSMGDPSYQLRQIFYLLLFLGAVNIAVGLVFYFGDFKVDALPGIGLMNTVLGVVQIALGFAISKGSMMALVAATVLMVADLGMTIVYAAGAMMPVIMKAFFVVFIVRGFRFVKEYKIKNI
ncbi:MAG: hypothetical protein CVU11_00470 [Bacteroidetes bacterium HGW-Bacteroidetes-6]|jgi:hypothetical protein|nr:MAG: hypothetical protein CVU11_00470 [Bacteroidetes bacterium HGW-Bacteroidetes-6]